MADKILFLAHTEPDGSLSRFALEALAAALGVGGDLVVGLVGVHVTAAPNCGAARYLAVEGEAFGHARYATDAAAAEALVRASSASIIVAPHTSRWARVMAGVAQRLSGRIDTHVAFLRDERARGFGHRTTRSRGRFVHAAGGGRRTVYAALGPECDDL